MISIWVYFRAPCCCHTSHCFSIFATADRWKRYSWTQMIQFWHFWLHHSIKKWMQNATSKSAIKRMRISKEEIKDFPLCLQSKLPTSACRTTTGTIPANIVPGPTLPPNDIKRWNTGFRQFHQLQCILDNRWWDLRCNETYRSTISTCSPFIIVSLSGTVWKHSRTQCVQPYASRSILARNCWRSIQNGEWLPRLRVQQRKEDPNATSEMLPAQWPICFHVHAYNWPIAKINHLHPSHAVHERPFLQPQTSSTKFGG